MSQAEWLELESDPGLFTLLLEDFGVQGVQVEEIYDLSKPITEIVYGFIFLFHWNKAKKKPCRRTGRGSTGSVSNTISPSSYTPVSTCDVRSNSVTPKTGNNGSRHRSASGSCQDIITTPESKSVGEISECKSIIPIPDKTEIFFAHQVVQNSCATHALLSILLNRPEINIGHMLAEFQKATRYLSPEAKGLAIGSMPQLAQAHNRHAAKPLTVCKDETISNLELPEPSQAAATAAAIAKASIGTVNCVNSSDSSPSLATTTGSNVTIPDTFHFVCYVPIGGFLYELDGLTSEPINHGPLKNPNDQFAWTEQCADVLKERMQEQDVRYNLLAVVPDRRVALTKRMQMLKRNRQLIQDILLRMCQFDHTSKSLHCSNSNNITVTTATTTITTTTVSINHEHPRNQSNCHRHLIQEEYKSSPSEHFINDDNCVHLPNSSLSVGKQYNPPCIEKCSPTSTNMPNCTNSTNTNSNNLDKNKHEPSDDFENSRSIKTRSATRAAKQTIYENHNYPESELSKSMQQKHNNNSLSDTILTDSIHSPTNDDYSTFCFSSRKRSSYSSPNEHDDPDCWECQHKKPYLHMSQQNDINNSSNNSCENGYNCNSQLEYSPNTNKINRIFASFISNNSPLSLTVLTETMSSTVRKSNINKVSHSVGDDCKESKGNLREIQDLENGIPNGISIKLQENCFHDVKNLHSLDHSSDQLTKVTSTSTSCTELNSCNASGPIYCGRSTISGEQNIPLKELTKPLTVETKLWCDTTSENLDAGDSGTPVTSDIYPTNSSITSSNEICGTVLDSRPQTRALTRASLKLNPLSSVQASTEERISTTKISSDNVQLNHESSVYNSDVSNKYRSPTEIFPMTTDLAEFNISTSSSDITSSHRGSKYPTRSSTRMDTLASHNLAHLRSNPVTLHSNTSPSKVGRITSFEQTSTVHSTSNANTNTTNITSTYLSPFTYDYMKLKNSPSLYPPPLSVEELNILLHKIDEQIKLCLSALIEEEEKRRSYRIDDARRIHNYEPFIRAFLTALARHGMLKDQVLSAMKLKHTSVINHNHISSIQVSDSCKKSNVKAHHNNNSNNKHVSNKIHTERIYSLTNNSSIKKRTYLSSSLINRLTRVSQSTNNNIRVAHHYNALNYRKLRRRRRMRDSIGNSKSSCTGKDTGVVELKSPLVESANLTPSYRPPVTDESLPSITSSASCSLQSVLTNSTTILQAPVVSTQSKNSRAIRINVNQRHSDETGESPSQGPLLISNSLCTDSCQKSSVTIDENSIVEGSLASSAVSSVTLASCSSCGSSPQSSNSSRSTNLRSNSSGVKLRQIKSDDRVNTRRSLRPRVSREHAFTQDANISADSFSLTSEDPDTNNSGVNLRDRTTKSSLRTHNTDCTNCTVTESSTSSNSQRFRKRRLH
ncbi:unnamed protein product [Schistosoma rodhaini]|uniref:ubiquitinyl hydrolase 1 n=2 Tax=Schistosoma rodhaini TaxID=6188 RepID=A0AA85EY11_9TREM|nr:unnamed protein product [Schistosoma rodhaini]